MSAALKPAEIVEARSWLEDCGLEPDAAQSASDRWIVAAIVQHYDGGLPAFVVLDVS